MSGLTAFRLSDVPLDVRLRAADRIARRSIEAIPEAPHAEDRLFARLLSPTGADDRDMLRRIAERPSRKVYWIPRAAWERVMRPC